MRYFTLRNDSLDWERDVIGPYLAHVEAFRVRLPHDLWLLASGATDLHDAAFDLVELGRGMLRLRLLTSGALHPMIVDLR